MVREEQPGAVLHRYCSFSVDSIFASTGFHMKYYKFPKHDTVHCISLCFTVVAYPEGWYTTPTHNPFLCDPSIVETAS